MTIEVDNFIPVEYEFANTRLSRSAEGFPVTWTASVSFSYVDDRRNGRAERTFRSLDEAREWATTAADLSYDMSRARDDYLAKLKALYESAKVTTTEENT